MSSACGLQSNTTETAVVDKPADEDEHVGHHHGHAH
jgi:chaperonin GroEL